ncbi:MAG: PilZ domain-containing protein [Sphingomonadaceae bacterium]
MKSALARFDPTTASDTAERRREKRHKAKYTAILQDSSGDRSEVQLLDVSTSGCNIRGDLDRFRPGSFVSIGIGENVLLGAIIRWVRGEEAGMEFLRAIPAEREEWFAIMDARF